MFVFNPLPLYNGATYAFSNESGSPSFNIWLKIISSIFYICLYSVLKFLNNINHSQLTISSIILWNLTYKC